MENGGRWSLRWVMTGLIVALLLVFGMTVTWVTRGRIHRGIEGQVATRSGSLANLLGRAVSADLAAGRPPAAEDLQSIAQEHDVIFVAVKDARGATVAQLESPDLEETVESLVEHADASASGRGSPRGSGVFVARAAMTADREAAFDGEALGPSAAAPGPRAGQVPVGHAYVGLSEAAMEAEVERATESVIWVTAGLVVLGSIVAFLVTRWVTKPLSDMVAFAAAMAHGDYEGACEVRSRTREVGELADAFAVLRRSLAMVAAQARSIAAGDLSRRVSGAGQLGEAFNAMVESLSMLVGQIKKASIQIASGSSQILAASKQAERGSAEQASSINQTTTTMDELLSASKQIAVSADSVVKIAERTLTAAQAGEEAVQQGIGGMEEISTNNRQTAERILELSERNQQIGNIVDLIDEIADKSDLLALNAAIEGAKAGEAGRGFAVVATEMRSLAENVVDSTKEIKTLISEIQKASNASVLATEGQMKATERGTQIAVRTGEQLQKILQMVEQTTEAAKQISLATQQQRTGTEQVVESIGEIAKIARSNVAGAAQTTASTVELANLAEDLRAAVSQFVLGPEGR